MRSCCSGSQSPTKGLATEPMVALASMKMMRAAPGGRSLPTRGMNRDRPPLTYLLLRRGRWSTRRVDTDQHDRAAQEVEGDHEDAGLGMEADHALLYEAELAMEPDLHARATPRVSRRRHREV